MQMFLIVVVEVLCCGVWGGIAPNVYEILDLILIVEGVDAIVYTISALCKIFLIMVYSV